MSLEDVAGIPHTLQLPDILMVKITMMPVLFRSREVENDGEEKVMPLSNLPNKRFLDSLHIDLRIMQGTLSKLFY